MFHKVRNVAATEDFILIVQFSEGVTKRYDLKPLFEQIPAFKALQESADLYYSVEVDVGEYLRKAVVYGKLKNGIDVQKFGKQWVVLKSAMIREYGKN